MVAIQRGLIFASNEASPLNKSSDIVMGAAFFFSPELSHKCLPRTFFRPLSNATMVLTYRLGRPHA